MVGCLALVCGLPGSGKTEFITYFSIYCDKLGRVNQVQDHNCSYNVHVIAFDELCSIEDQAKISKSVNGWRNFRLQILEASERYICGVCGIDCLLEGPLNCRGTEFIEILKRRNTFKFEATKFQNSVFLIEDNFYYRSMRHEWFQVAKRANIGFCEIFMSCPLNVALQRNETRNCSIPEHLIRLMHSSMEIPDPKKYKWEKFSLIFESKEELKVSKVLDVAQFIQRAAKEPAEIIVNENKIVDQEICSKNVMHQVDKTLRKLIGKLIKDMKDDKNSRLLKTNILNVVSFRRAILSELKNKELILPHDLTNSIQLGINSENVSNRLEAVLWDILIKKARA